jgi:hypothetical protein
VKIVMAGTWATSATNVTTTAATTTIFGVSDFGIAVADFLRAKKLERVEMATATRTPEKQLKCLDIGWKWTDEISSVYGDPVRQDKTADRGTNRWIWVWKQRRNQYHVIIDEVVGARWEVRMALNTEGRPDVTWMSVSEPTNHDMLGLIQACDFTGQRLNEQ